ncbi:hypothetical protein CRG98_032783 [Punica granatum]|uniref:RNA-dependent RNA polymerase n=1 Tax=Punica granatum TaxID=22663 RepID=A0A2I0IS68_PUNGR|nr:hypothetical protein CRG98_032783 [Punica granatum]
MGKTVNLHGFPSSTSAQTVQGFLEQITGEGTVYAIKVRPAKSGSRLYAIVQFMTAEDADRIIRLASPRLWYGKSYLTARKVEHDIVPKPRILSHSMEGVTLHFGCQISEQQFSTLWKVQNVSVDFGVGLRRFYFVLFYNRVEYKLDLSYENIWQIKLQRQRGRGTIYLLIQLFGAPRIFRKDANTASNILESPLYNYCKVGSDDQWVRATDFTPSACIGQSSVMCLEIFHASKLPDFQENFAAYREIEGIFAMESGSSFSRNLNLVPIVQPPIGSDIPYKILFKINLLVQNGCLPGPCLDSSFYRLVDPRRVDVSFIEVQITPCKVYFSGPEVNVSNRVLRRYSEYTDNFLRISFVDEDLDKVHSTVLSPRGSVANSGMRTEIFTRILSTLQNGITIGDKKFEFLAFSSSQLRENSAWMFAPIDGCTADTIRESIGEFHQIRNVAIYAARLGQSLSSSTETLSVEWYETEEIPDIEVIRGGKRYIFSDGIGKVSEDFAKKVAKKCSFKGYTPSAFQIRYGGYKGVVAIDPTLPVKLSLRKSMRKYESSDTKLNVLAWSKYQPCFLNRQIISLLSTLGVPDEVFERKQREAVDQLDSILKDPLKAQEALDLMAPGENTQVLKQMLGRVVVAKNPCLHPGDVRVLRAVNEVEEYFVNYILNDSLGIIANAHTVFADRSSAKARCPECIELAKLFSIAVDFPKTGVPAEIPPNLYAKEYPDFMEKLDKPTYESKNVIGKLFREVRDIAPDSTSLRTFMKEDARRSYDPDMEVEGFEDYALRKEARTWFNEKATGSDSLEPENLDAKASAWYYVTYHPSYWGVYNEGLKRDHYLSFPWCVYDRLLEIKKEKSNTRRYARSLEDIFTRGLRLS